MNSANRSILLLHGKSFRIVSYSRCRFERTRYYLSTTTGTTGTASSDALELNIKSHHQRITGESLLNNSRKFLEQYDGSSNMRRRNLEQANEFLRNGSRSTIPKNLHSTWIPIADQLMNSILGEFEKFNERNEELKNQQLLPNSDNFCSIITMYSKSQLPDSAEKADYWLQTMIRTSELYPERVSAPRATLFANVLAAWGKSMSSPGAERRAEILWNQLNSMKGLTPSSSAYYLYISLWSKSELANGPEIAESLLREFVHEGKRNRELIPSCATFVNVISSWRRVGDSGNSGDSQIAADRAQAVLDLLITDYVRRSKLKHEWLKIDINDIPFNATIQTIATSREIPPQQAEKKIDFIFKRMKELGVQPTMVTAWSALNLYEASVDGDRNQADAIDNVPMKIIRLLDVCMSQYGGKKNPMLQNQIFSKAVAICSAKTISSSENCQPAEIVEEILLNRYFKLSRKERRIETTIDGFEHSIKAWVNDKNHSAAEKECRILHLLGKLETEVNHIINIYKRKHENDPSVCKLYASLAKAWIMGRTPEIAQQRVEENVERLLVACKGRPPEFLPSTECFQDIIETARENLITSDANDVIERIYKQILANESIFHRMVNNINTESKSVLSAERFLNHALDALVTTRKKNSGRIGEIILLKLQDLHEKSACSKPTFETFKKILYCWSYSEEDNAAERMDNMLMLAQSLSDAGDNSFRPDFDGYMAVINAWSRSRMLDAPEKIQSHLKSLQERRLEGDLTFRIDSRIYIDLIRAYSITEREDSQVMANTIFESAPDHLRDTNLYNVFIEAQGGDSSRAEELLQIMHLLYFEGDEKVKPDTETFNAVIKVWLRSGSPMAAWRVDGLFDRMQYLTSSGKLNVKPNSRTFDLVISTLANEWGTELTKVDKYLALLRKHYRLGDCIPTARSYTEAIRAWVSYHDDPRAILRAQALLDEMHELARDGLASMRPNRNTYEMYLDGLQHSFVEDRTHLVNDVLFKMKENNIDLDSDMRSCIRRCLLPMSSRANAWIVDVDEQITVNELDENNKQIISTVII